MIKRPFIISKENFLKSHGYPFMGGADFSLHKSHRRMPESRKKNATQRMLNDMRINEMNRKRMGDIFDELLVAGLVRQPSHIESICLSAQGLPELAATQASKRLLKKYQITDIEAKKMADEIKKQKWPFGEGWKSNIDWGTIDANKRRLGDPLAKKGPQPFVIQSEPSKVRRGNSKIGAK